MNKFENVQVYLAVPLDYKWPNPTLLFNFSPILKEKL